MNQIDVAFHEHRGKTACQPGNARDAEMVYQKEGNANKFVIRQGNQ